MNDSTQRELDCPHCGALVQSDWAECWLCHGSLKEAPRVGRPPVRKATPSDQQPVSGNVVIAVVALAALLVWVGVTALAPGLGVLMLVAIVPAVVRTAIVTHKRSSLGKGTSHGQTALMFLLSLVLTGTMLVVTGFIAFWTFCLTCLGAAAVTGVNYSDDLSVPIAVSSIVTLTIVGLLIWLFSKLVRTRYRQDVTKQ